MIIRRRFRAMKENQEYDKVNVRFGRPLGQKI